MARLSPATRDSVPEAQRDAFDEIIGSGSPPAVGPGSITIHVPEAGKRASALNQYLREESSLPKKIQELAMLVTARENDCQYIWYAHAAAGRRAGLSDDLVNNLRDKRPLTGISAQESAVVEFGQEYFRTRRVSQAAFDAALSEFGVRGLAELTSLMGYYALLAFNINAFEMLPEGGEEALLPV